MVTNHIRHHLSQLKDASQYAIALEAQVAPPPAAGSTEKEMLAFQAEDVIYLTRSVDAHAGTFTDPDQRPWLTACIRARRRVGRTRSRGAEQAWWHGYLADDPTKRTGAFPRARVAVLSGEFRSVPAAIFQLSVRSLGLRRGETE